MSNKAHTISTLTSILQRSPTEEEILEWERREEGTSKVSGATHLALQHRSACWLCGHLQSRYEAARSLTIHGYADKDGNPLDKYVCQNCQIPMAYTVPFYGPDSWRRPDTLTLEQTREILCPERSHT